MNIFLITMIFIMGTFFGSFFTLAVYRIPLKKDITHEHSFCPNCNHKLGVLDLIPVWSYLILGGKCRYCGQKIRIRYLLLEVLSGVVFAISFISLNMKFPNFDLDKTIYFISFVFIYITCVLVAGIDKENTEINSSILLFGEGCQTLYMVYLYIVDRSNMYRYSIYFTVFAVLFMILKKVEQEKQNYGIEIALFITYIVSILDFKAVLPIFILSIIFACIFRKFGKQKYNSLYEIPIGFVTGFSTVCYIIVQNFMAYWIV